MVAVVLDDDTDWSEVEELVAESYRLLAPDRLVRELDASGSSGSPAEPPGGF